MIKKLIFVIIVLFKVNVCLNAQYKEPQPFDKWLGLWKSTNVNDSICLFIIRAITLVEEFLHDSTNKPHDLLFKGLYGWHSIKNGDKVLESSFAFISNRWNEHATITSFIRINKDGIRVDINNEPVPKVRDNLGLILNNFTRDANLSGELILTGENEATLKTYVTEKLGRDTKKFIEGYAFPKEVKFIRVFSVSESN